MDTVDLYKALMKVAVKRVIELLDKKRYELSITQIGLSREAGLTDNAFAKNLSEMEDITLSRFINYWCSMIRITENKGKHLSLNELQDVISESVQRIADLACQVATADLNLLSTSEKMLFVSLHNDITQLHEKRTISDEAFRDYMLIYNCYSRELEEGSAE